LRAARASTSFWAEALGHSGEPVLVNRSSFAQDHGGEDYTLTTESGNTNLG
jgi:hypothetical protein